jgi:pilus assembly protein CpaE
LTDHAGQLDWDVLGNVLTYHPSGIHVLLAPRHPDRVETIPASLPAEVVSGYRRIFDYVVVDTHPSLDESTLQLLDVADRIVLVTTPELSSIRRVAEIVRLAPTLGWEDKLMLVLNRANSGVEVHQVEQALGMPVEARVVSAGQRVVEAANRGQPALLADATASEQITRDLLRLVARVVDAPCPSWESRAAACLSPFGRLWRLLAENGQRTLAGARALATVAEAQLARG